MTMTVTEIPSGKFDPVGKFEFVITYHQLPDLQQVRKVGRDVFPHKVAAHCEASFGWSVKYRMTDLIAVIRNSRGEVDNVYYMGEAAFPF